MNVNEHPTAADRLRHFLATVEDYERLDRAVPIGRSVNLFGHGDDELRRWHVVLHAMLLRKYFAPTDRLYLVRVVEAARQCATDTELPSTEWDALLANVARMEDGIGSVFGSDPRVYSNAELLMAQLYGRFLHGDFGKWKTSEMAGDSGTDTAVFSATVSRADRVLRLAQWLRLGAEEGGLQF